MQRPGNEDALLRFLASTCPINPGRAGSSTGGGGGRGGGGGLGGRGNPTMEEFNTLQQQVKDMRRYFKAYVKTEARKRDRAALRIQAAFRGHTHRRSMRHRRRKAAGGYGSRVSYGRPAGGHGRGLAVNRGARQPRVLFDPRRYQKDRIHLAPVKRSV